MSTNISYQTIESRLPELAETTTAQELGYDLLRIFNGMSETRINRIKDGKDNISKDPNSFVVKKLLAYSHCTTENLVESLEALKQNEKINNHEKKHQRDKPANRSRASDLLSSRDTFCLGPATRDAVE